LLIFVNVDEVYDEEENKAQLELYPVSQAYSHHKKNGRKRWLDEEWLFAGVGGVNFHCN